MRDLTSIARDVRRRAERDRRADVSRICLVVESLEVGNADLPDEAIVELRDSCRKVAAEYGDGETADVARALHDRLSRIAARRAEERARDERRKAQFYAPR